MDKPAKPLPNGPLPVPLDSPCYLRVRVTGYYPESTHWRSNEAVVHLIDKQGRRVDDLDRFVPMDQLIPMSVVRGEQA